MHWGGGPHAASARQRESRAGQTGTTRAAKAQHHQKFHSLAACLSSCTPLLSAVQLSCIAVRPLPPTTALLLPALRIAAGFAASPRRASYSWAAVAAAVQPRIPTALPPVQSWGLPARLPSLSPRHIQDPPHAHPSALRSLVAVSDTRSRASEFHPSLRSGPRNEPAQSRFVSAGTSNLQAHHARAKLRDSTAELRHRY